MRPIEFVHAKMIGPCVGTWPEMRTQPLYWVAQKTFSLSDAVDSAEFLIVADRHYELYINGRSVGRQRNFFNGDECVFAQRWGERIFPLLRHGENTIDVVIRSDPWRNKNYSCFKPMLVLEALINCGDKTVCLQTDESWQVAVVENWREQIAVGANGTIHFEWIIIPLVGKAILSGFADELHFTASHVLDSGSFPPVYLWNDPPKRIDINSPCEVVAAGTYELPEQALIFDIGSGVANSDGETVIVETSFDDTCGRELNFASSSLVLHRIELNGEVISENKSVPDKYQMSLVNYLVPTSRAVTVKGCNQLRIIVSKSSQGWRPLRLAVNSRLGNWTYGDDRAANATIEPLELSERIGAKFAKRMDDAVSVVQNPFSVEVSPTVVQAFALLDFSKVATGRLRLKIDAASSGQIFLAYGLGHQGQAVDCHRMQMRAVDVLEISAGESVYTAFDVRTFRYLDMLFEGFSGSIVVSDIQVEEQVFVDESHSSLKTSDSTVNNIWFASRRTAQLCSNELYIDNPEREHSQWIDCTNAVASAGYYVFAEKRKVAKVLEEYILNQQPDGQLPGYAPGKWFPRKPLQCHMALFCLLSHRHFMHTGDEVLGAKTLNAILKIIEFWQGRTNNQGLICDLNVVFIDWGSHIYSYGIDWECGKSTGALTTLNAYYLGVLRAAAEMARFLGRDKEALELAKTADSVRCSITKQMYDLQLGLFRDGVGEALAESNVSQTGNALAVLFGAAPEGQEKAILTKAFGPDKLGDIIPANAHFARQAGMALFEAGCDELALSWLTNGFGPMIDAGPGTLWETWQSHASLCQATGSAPAYLFSRYLAGVYPAEPGYRKIGIDPHPSGLPFLSATLATPLGLIGVKWQRKKSGLDYQLCLPAGLRDCPILKPECVDLLIEIEN